MRWKLGPPGGKGEWQSSVGGKYNGSGIHGFNKTETSLSSLETSATTVWSTLECSALFLRHQKLARRICVWERWISK